MGYINKKFGSYFSKIIEQSNEAQICMLKNTKKILRKLITLNSSSKITFKENSANMEHYDTILMILYYFTHDNGYSVLSCFSHV